MLIWVLRALFVLGGTATAYSVGLATGSEKDFLFILLGLLVCGGLIFAEWYLSRSRISVISSIVFGSLVGILLAVLVKQVIVLSIGPFPEEKEAYEQSLSLSLIVVFTYLCTAFIYQTRDKFRFLIPYVEFRREEKTRRPIVLDTSVIIDGRIAELFSTGVLEGSIVVPQLVLDELHRIADSDDKLKRERGRLGLETLNDLRNREVVDIHIEDSLPAKERPVDEQLIDIAQKLSARIMTNDFNLNRLATLAGVDVINLNEVANALKPIALPDEKIEVKLIKRGEQRGQAVGFLQDGTMVIVDDAVSRVGQEVKAVVTNTITRETGRIIFAELAEKSSSSSHGRRSGRGTN